MGRGKKQRSAPASWRICGRGRPEVSQTGHRKELHALKRCRNMSIVGHPAKLLACLIRIKPDEPDGQETWSFGVLLRDGKLITHIRVQGIVFLGGSEQGGILLPVEGALSKSTTDRRALTRVDVVRLVALGRVGTRAFHLELREEHGASDGRAGALAVYRAGYPDADRRWGMTDRICPTDLARYSAAKLISEGACPQDAIVMTGYKRVPGISKETTPCGLNALETFHPLHS